MIKINILYPYIGEQCKNIQNKTQIFYSLLFPNQQINKTCK